MSISTIAVQTLTGPAPLLNRLVKELVEGYCHSEDIMFLDEVTVQVTLYNGSGSTLLHHADALSVEYPELDIRAVEWVDCFEDVCVAYWKSGRKIYQCDMCEIVSCEMGWLPSSPHGIAMCQNGRWKKRLRERTADEGYSDRR
ncbi:hypothetical protein A4R89_15005 (plasmid) [Acetobacter ascendens]|nr:hypothetical protein A4R89_15005 [Acetobacter ascendens]